MKKLLEPNGSQAIGLLVEGDVILDAAFHGGCNVRRSLR